MDDRLKLTFDNSDLYAVPAVHYSVPFAVFANRLCVNQKTRPDAIVVELGPETASEVISWMKELGLGKSNSPMPCMLCLTKIDTGMNCPKDNSAQSHLNDYKDINRCFTGSSDGGRKRYIPEVLPLSPIDSIIKAIRCSLEYDLPLYGIDIECIDPPDHKNIMIQDPHLRHENMEEYIRRNAKFAAHGRDPGIDHRRETVMVGRLKTILKRHNRVLFTGGLAHWFEIRNMLQDDHFRPIPLSETGTVLCLNFIRSIMHPVMAISRMDLFPQVVEKYELFRSQAANHTDQKPCGLDLSVLPAGLLERTYKNYFNHDKGGSENINGIQDLNSKVNFEYLIKSICMVRQKLIPNVNVFLKAANSMMSQEFCDALSKSIFLFNWASTEDFRDLPVLRYSKFNSSGSLMAEYIDATGAVGKQFPIRFRAGKIEKVNDAHINWKWKKEPAQAYPKNQTNIRRTWPPGDFLLTSLFHQARQSARNKGNGYSSKPFEGSMLEGLDMKATMRAVIQNEDRIYVKDLTRYSKSGFIPDDGFDPTVFLFNPGTKKKPSCRLFYGSMKKMHMEHVKSPALLENMILERGENAVNGVGFSDNGNVRPPKPLAEAGVEVENLLGLVIFIIWHFTGVQEAYWLEKTDYTRNPIFSHEGLSDLIKMYRHRHSIDLDRTDWPTFLIKMAIPYAKKTVTIIAPDHFLIAPTAYEEAKRHHVSLCHVPLSHLSGKLLKRAAKQYIVSPIDKEGREFPECYEHLLNEKPDAFKYLVPEKYLNFGIHQPH